MLDNVWHQLKGLDQLDVSPRIQQALHHHKELTY